MCRVTAVSAVIKLLQLDIYCSVANENVFKVRLHVDFIIIILLFKIFF